MPTSVYIPAALLERVDRRAKALGISRNRVIVGALEATLEPRGEWPSELRQMLSEPLPRAAADALEDTLGQVRARRVTRKNRSPL